MKKVRSTLGKSLSLLPSFANQLDFSDNLCKRGYSSAYVFRRLKKTSFEVQFRDDLSK